MQRLNIKSYAPPALGVFMLATAVLSAISCRPGSPSAGPEAVSGELVVFHAGSLSVPFRAVSDLFKEKHPNIAVKPEAAGSRDCARKISDLGRRCDVLGMADYQVVENLLMPDHADFNIRFATNEMAIAYTGGSARHEQINADNWHQILLQAGVNFGRSDPNRDPCGYRTVMVFQLAERHYGIPGLAAKLEAKGGMRFVRPKATDSLALLESGEIDYLFTYRSVARQHGLNMIELPDEVNLRAASLSDIYKTAVVEVTGKQPGETIKRSGAPIVYSVTIPKDAANRELAEAYVALLLSEEGQAIMRANGQTPIVPARADRYDKLPEILKPFCE